MYQTTLELKDPSVANFSVQTWSKQCWNVDVDPLLLIVLVSLHILSHATYALHSLWLNIYSVIFSVWVQSISQMQNAVFIFHLKKALIFLFWKHLVLKFFNFGFLKQLLTGAFFGFYLFLSNSFSISLPIQFLAEFLLCLIYWSHFAIWSLLLIHRKLPWTLITRASTFFSVMQSKEYSK